MSGICKCDLSFGNTGKPNCVPLQSAALAEIYVPLYGSSGAENYFDNVATPLTPAVLTAKLNAADKRNRWYPVKEITGITGERATPVLETLDNGKVNKIKDGVKNRVYQINEGTPVLLGKLEQFGCQKFGVYYIDENGSLIGRDKGDGKLYPFPIENRSYYARFVDPTFTTSQKVEVGYQFSQELKDSEIGMISSSAFTANLLSAEGLIDVSSEISNESTTGFTAKLKTDYGDVGSEIVKEGLVIGDFALYNVTDSATVALTSVTESAEGVYDFVFAAQTSADALRLTPTKDGYDFSAVVENTILVP
jgi:uncharacterized protein YbaR (Trm112 family)